MPATSRRKPRTNDPRNLTNLGTSKSGSIGTITPENAKPNQNIVNTYQSAINTAYNPKTTTNDLNNLYKNLTSSALTSNELAREKSITAQQDLYGQVENRYADIMGQLNLQQQNLAPQYQNLRDDNFFNTLQGLRNIDEIMANRGMATGGANRQAQLQQSVAGQEQNYNIGLNEQSALRSIDAERNSALRSKVDDLNRIDRAIALLKTQGAREDSALVQDLEAKKVQASMDLNQLNFENEQKVNQTQQQGASSLADYINQLRNQQLNQNADKRATQLQDYNISTKNKQMLEADEMANYGTTLSPTMREYRTAYESLPQETIARLQPYQRDYAARINELMETDPNNSDLEALQTLRAMKVLADPVLREQYGNEYGMTSTATIEASRGQQEVMMEQQQTALMNQLDLIKGQLENEKEVNEIVKIQAEVDRIFADTDYKDTQAITEQFKALQEEIKYLNLPQQIKLGLQKDMQDIANGKALESQRYASARQSDSATAENYANIGLINEKKETERLKAEELKASAKDKTNTFTEFIESNFLSDDYKEIQGDFGEIKQQKTGKKVIAEEDKKYLFDEFDYQLELIATDENITDEEARQLESKMYDALDKYGLRREFEDFSEQSNQALSGQNIFPQPNDTGYETRNFVKGRR